MPVATDKKALSQAIAHIPKADTAEELEPILDSVFKTVARAENDNAGKTLVTHTAHLMHQVREEIKKAEQDSSSAALTAAIKAVRRHK